MGLLVTLTKTNAYHDSGNSRRNLPVEELESIFCNLFGCRLLFAFGSWSNHAWLQQYACKHHIVFCQVKEHLCPHLLCKPQKLYQFHALHPTVSLAQQLGPIHCPASIQFFRNNSFPRSKFQISNHQEVYYVCYCCITSQSPSCFFHCKS